MPSFAPRGRPSSRTDRFVLAKSQNNQHHISSLEQYAKRRHLGSPALPVPEQETARRERHPSKQDQRLWPLHPTLRRVITFFPIGSLWLNRLEADETARLDFFRHLHCFYNNPLMRMSSANKQRALLISNYITELETHVKNTTGAPAKHRKPYGKDSTRRKPPSRKRPCKHKEQPTLTKENLAQLEGSLDVGDDEVSVSPSSRSYLKRQRSKAFKEEQKEQFTRKRQSQVEAEAGQSRMLSKG